MTTTIRQLAKNLKGTAFAAFTAAALLATPEAKAVLTLDFDDNQVHGGTISYDGNGGALVGTNILFNTITPTDTPANSGITLDIVGGLLNFSTGANISEVGTYTFNGGGTFTLTGTAKNGATTIATGTLVSGTFTGVPQVTFGAQQFNFSSFGLDTKNTDLLNFYGITGNDFIFSNTTIVGAGAIATNGGFTSTVQNADFNNTVRVVPDSGMTVVLLGLSLLGLGAYASRVRAIA